MQTSSGPGGAKASPGLWTLALGSIGVVYGDIGTSPLYAFREALHQANDDGIVTTLEIYGVLSLILWALFLIVTCKYVLILLRTDNNGEGGSLSLMALARSAMGPNARFVVALGIIAAALFYGDAIITPAISVLSAIEGMKLITAEFDPYVLPLTVVIIIALFAAQSSGTARMATFFGPITLVWFITMAVAGLAHLVKQPQVIMAINPVYGVEFLAQHGKAGRLVLGAVFLAVTGAEALYTDLGHFGRDPIRLAWLFVVFPALALNYLGQGALVLSNPEAMENPFYRLFPGWLLIPAVILATLATVIAGQAVITGAYSITRQAIQLGFFPRLEVRHTSEAHSGQIYMPQVNGSLMLGVLFLVLVFESSDRLANAYGIAVTGTMCVTAILAFIVIWKVYRWNPIAAAAVMAPFLVIDLSFLGANMLKVHEGGWMPLVLAACLMGVMVTWKRGSRILMEKSRKGEVPLTDLIASLERRPPHIVPGTAVFLTSDPDFAPAALLHNLKHNKVLHESNIILTIVYGDRPHVPAESRVLIEPVSERFMRITMKFGYMDAPNVPEGLALARKAGVKFDIMSTSFFLSRRSIKPGTGSGLTGWQHKLFIGLTRNANDATDFFMIPTSRVVEVGTQITV